MMMTDLWLLQLRLLLLLQCQALQDSSGASCALITTKEATDRAGAIS
jgi:hypothetical protein